jgi:hypothetical protein
MSFAYRGYITKLSNFVTGSPSLSFSNVAALQATNRFYALIKGATSEYLVGGMHSLASQPYNLGLYSYNMTIGGLNWIMMNHQNVPGNQLGITQLSYQTFSNIRYLYACGYTMNNSNVEGVLIVTMKMNGPDFPTNIRPYIHKEGDLSPIQCLDILATDVDRFRVLAFESNHKIGKLLEVNLNPTAGGPQYRIYDIT